MGIFKLVQVFSAAHLQEDIYNDKQVAFKAFQVAKENGFVWGARLYTCEFVNGKLANKECLAQKNNNTTKK